MSSTKPEAVNIHATSPELRASPGGKGCAVVLPTMASNGQTHE